MIFMKVPLTLMIRPLYSASMTPKATSVPMIAWETRPS